MPTRLLGTPHGRLPLRGCSPPLQPGPRTREAHVGSPPCTRSSELRPGFGEPYLSPPSLDALTDCRRSAKGSETRAATGPTTASTSTYAIDSAPTSVSSPLATAMPAITIENSPR